MQDTIYYLIIVIYYLWYFHVKNVILGLGDLFPCFQVHLMLFRLNFIPDMVRYQLGIILEYIFLSVKFYGALKQSSKSVNVFQILLIKLVKFILFGSLKNYSNLLGIPVAFISTYQMEFSPPFMASSLYRDSCLS